MSYINPTPTVTLDGVLIAAGRNPDGTLPAALVIEDLSWDWGRDHVLTQPAPGTGRVVLFLPDPAWLRARAATLIGTPIVFGYTWDDPTDAARDRTAPTFIGRVSAFTPTRVELDGVRGVRLELRCSHRLTELANLVISTGAAGWPEETIVNRVVRINLLTSPIIGFGMRAYFDNTYVAAIPPMTDISALDMLSELFDTTGGDRMVYVPSANQLHPTNRRVYSFTGLAHLTTATTGPRAGTVFVNGFGIDNPGSELTDAPAMYLDGALIEPLGDPGKDITARVTRVELKYPDTQTDRMETIVKIVSGTNEVTDGRRTLSVTTAHVHSAWADQTAWDFAGMAAVEGAAWQMPSLRWDTARSGGGFDSIEQVDFLLCGFERGGYFVLSRSEYSDLGIPPFFGIMGGTIRYTRGAWVVDINPAPTLTTGGTPSLQLQHVAAAGYDFPLSTFHESVSLADLGFVSRGYGQTAIYSEPT